MRTSKLLSVCWSLCCAALLLGVVSVSAAPSATVTTNRYDYVPGQTVVVTGSGYLAGETVTITLQESPNIDTHGPYTSVADGSGSFVNSSFVTNAADVGVTFTLTATGQTSGRSAQTTFVDANEAANLDQARNGTPASPTSPVDFQNGNAGASNSHFIESHSIPYRIEFTDLCTTAPCDTHYVDIEWDLRTSGKNALDYITQYDRLLPHTQFPGHASTGNPE